MRASIKYNLFFKVLRRSSLARWAKEAMQNIWGQFHQHFPSSFYKRRSQKHKKYCPLDWIFTILRSLQVKAVSKHVDEIDTWSEDLPNWIRDRLSGKAVRISGRCSTRPRCSSRTSPSSARSPSAPPTPSASCSRGWSCGLKQDDYEII